jgi:DNA polymerase I-like protein with 3'-5' exonuclease and polymerase domains
MNSREFIRQRICIFAGQDIDPDSDQQVEEVLRNKFNVRLPQRRSLNESLDSAISDHEIIALILKYRTAA